MSDQKQELLTVAEKAAEAVVNIAFDKVTDALVEEAKKAIPGQVDDAILDMLKPVLAPKLKELLLAEIKKIDGKA